MKLSLSWGVGEDGGHTSSFSWENVVVLLNRLKTTPGDVGLSILDAEIGPQGLQVMAENGLYLLTLGEDTGEDYQVRTLYDASIEYQNIEILGNSWDSRTTTKNFELVYQIFKEFYDTGDVSHNLMSL